MDNFRLFSAIKYAVDHHRYQRRKSDDSSYIVHPMEVAEILLQAGVKDEDILIAAVLHDVVEDTDGTLDEIEKKFGSTVAGYVDEVSDDKSLPKLQRKILQIEHARSASKGAQLIKCADKISNLRNLSTNPPKGWNQMTIDGYYLWSREVVSGIWDVNPYLKAELRHIFAENISMDNPSLRLQEYYNSMN